MQIENIDRVLIFREDPGVLTQQQLADLFKITPNGSLQYYGIVSENVLNRTQTGRAMNPALISFMKDIVSSLTSGTETEKTVVLGLEPNETTDGPPFDFVMKNLDLLRALGTEVADLQLQAAKASKRLNVIMRYASEMNAGEAHYAGDPAGFKQTFPAVREAVQSTAPNVLFSFSPALRADIDESKITDYWPGDDHVDIIGATWYSHGDLPTRQKAAECMKKYFRHRRGVGKAFGLDEFGGAEGTPTTYRDNDDALQEMLHVIAALQIEKISFTYGVIFVTGEKWGIDVTLDFLQNVA